MSWHKKKEQICPRGSTHVDPPANRMAVILRKNYINALIGDGRMGGVAVVVYSQGKRERERDREIRCITVIALTLTKFIPLTLTLQF